MRKIVCFVLALCWLPFLTACDISKDSSLSEISRPYTGEYVCKTLTVGGEDMLSRFEYIKLNLGYGKDFKLFYQTVDGGEGGYHGEYEISEGEEQITFTANTALRTVTRSFPYRKGNILIDLNFGGRLFHAAFSFPG